MPAVTMRVPAARPPFTRIPLASAESATLRSDTVLAGRSTTQTKVSPSLLRIADVGHPQNFIF